MTVPMVYQAIANITDAISKVGVAKSRNNPQQGYKFRGIDDIYNALAPELAKQKLCILPNVLDRSCEEHTSARGGALFYVTVRVRFDFVSAEDGSKHEVVTLGEAMDSGDKATNKAMSAAYKYATMMAFCIPTIGEDSENETHETQSRSTTKPPPAANDREPPPRTPLSKLLAPPHDPVTGEIAPHTVPLELTDRGYDFTTWGRKLIAGVKTSSTLDEARKWEKLNVEAMKLADGTKALKAVIRAFEIVYAQFEPRDEQDLLAAETNVLGTA